MARAMWPMRYTAVIAIAPSIDIVIIMLPAATNGVKKRIRNQRCHPGENAEAKDAVSGIPINMTANTRRKRSGISSLDSVAT